MIAWLDLETTGLDEKKGSILEIASVLTDDDLNEIGRYQSIVRPLHLRGYEVMDDFVYEMHTKSGLLTEIYQGHHGDTDAGWGRTVPTLAADLPRLGEVERAVINWLYEVVRQHAKQFKPPTEPLHEDHLKVALRQVPIAGNSVHFDRQWLREHMPDLEALFSHRHIDMSSNNEQTKRWLRAVYDGRPGEKGVDGKAVAVHRAMADVEASIATARYYRKQLFSCGFAEKTA